MSGDRSMFPHGPRVLGKSEAEAVFHALLVGANETEAELLGGLLAERALLLACRSALVKLLAAAKHENFGRTSHRDSSQAFRAAIKAAEEALNDA